MTDTLAEARIRLRAEMNGEGAHCPCCGRWAKVNPFHITAAARGRAILWFRAIHQSRPGEWISTHQYPRWMVKTHNYPSLKHWGLIEELPKPDDPKAKVSGFWRITPSGLDFAEGRIMVPKTAWVYDSECLKLTGHHVGIRACTGLFSYSEMMSLRFNET